MVTIQVNKINLIVLCDERNKYFDVSIALHILIYNYKSYSMFVDDLRRMKYFYVMNINTEVVKE